MISSVAPLSAEDKLPVFAVLAALSASSICAFCAAFDSLKNFATIGNLPNALPASFKIPGPNNVKATSRPNLAIKFLASVAAASASASACALSFSN